MPRAAQSRAGKTSERESAGVALSVGALRPERLFVGTSGWAYPTWKPEFYPAKTPARRFLAAYSERLSSVEVNYTFRTLPTAAMLAGWLEQTPAHFRFSFKAPQRITHFSRLRECDAPVGQFVEALAPVREAGRLGLLLFQLPPNFAADGDRLRGLLDAPALRALDAPRVAFEFRHSSWFDEAMLTILRERDAALCMAESDELVTPEVHTARTHTCFRLRRNGGYSGEELGRFAERFVALAEGAEARDVFVYHKHEDEPTGPLNASEVRRLAAAIAGRGARA